MQKITYLNTPLPQETTVPGLGAARRKARRLAVRARNAERRFEKTAKTNEGLARLEAIEAEADAAFEDFRARHKAAIA